MARQTLDSFIASALDEQNRVEGLKDNQTEGISDTHTHREKRSMTTEIKHKRLCKKNEDRHR